MHAIELGACTQGATLDRRNISTFAVACDFAFALIARADRCVQPNRQPLRAVVGAIALNA
jgi:hypothetical protein